jgi:hypothetical protein
VTSPTARTLTNYRDNGFAVAVAERWIAQTRQRRDLFGFIDAVALHPTEGIIALQCCAGASHADRRKKILAEPNAELWLRAGGRVQIVSWAKKGPRGRRKLWQARVEELNLQDITGGAA